VVTLCHLARLTTMVAAKAFFTKEELKEEVIKLDFELVALL
jgi:hypothetical protein